MNPIDRVNNVFTTVNDAMSFGAAVLCVGMVAFGLLALAMIVGAKHGATQTGRLFSHRERMRFSSTSKLYLSTLPDKVQYVLVGAAALLVALLVVGIGGVLGFVIGGVVLLLFMGLRYWLAL